MQLRYMKSLEEVQDGAAKVKIVEFIELSGQTNNELVIKAS